jgi:uncharacterized protein with HEPN domain
VLHGTDRDGSDIDLLVDALPGATLFDLGGLQDELESLLGLHVDLLTPATCRRNSGPRCSRRRSRYEREPSTTRLPRPHPAGRSRCLRLRGGLAKEDFLEDKRTQQAVIMSLIIGEAVTKVMDRYAEFAQAHGQVPWRNMRGMRNRIAHGYFDINLDVVWDTVQAALPELLKQLPAVRQDADDEDCNDYGMEP